MSSPLENDLFDQLKLKAEQKEIDEREKKLNTRIQAQHDKQSQRLAGLISNNNTSPVTISEVRVIGAPNTRTNFLERLCTPLLSSSRGSPYTLLEARQEIDKVALTLRKLGIFRDPISVYLDKPDPTIASSTPTDLHVFFNARERDWKTITTGMEAGSSEGSVYGSAQFRNLFGGAESLNVYASRGSRTRSIYSAWFDTPILSNPDLRWEIGGHQSATLKPWASHEEVLKGGSTKFKYLTSSGHRHELGYSGSWRQITGLTSDASPSVRLEAGDSFKSSLQHTWVNDQRDSSLLPTSGYFLKTTSELAGYGPLGGDVGFAKAEVETQAALPIPIPGVSSNTGIALNAGFRAGLLYPLLAGSSKALQPSRLSDRFQLGGPTDVRGFKISGLGPHDGQDAVGGDVYAAGGLSLLAPLPRTGVDTPLRLQAFINAGRLLALKGLPKDSPMTQESVSSGVKKTVEDLKNGLPSAAAGVGLVYAHPAARFEINFSVPLVRRREELTRKGLQFGIGVTFL